MSPVSGATATRFLSAMAGLVLLCSGCQGALVNYSGAKVVDSSRIAIVDGAQRSGQYRSEDVTIDYRALRNGNELQLSGVAVYTAKIRNGYRLVPYFYLSVFLIDQNGTVLRENGIITPGSDDPNNSMRFAAKIQLPPGTAYIAFSYTGEARDGSAGSQTEPFWYVPIVR